MFFDAGDRGADQSAYGVDRGQPRRPFRAAPQARPKPCTLGGCRTGIEAHVAAFGRARGTDGAAINVRGGHAYEKPAVEAPVAGAHRAKTAFRVEFHGCIVAKTHGKYSPFSDVESDSSCRARVNCPARPVRGPATVRP